VTEGSDNGVSLAKIDKRENNSDVKGRWPVKAFVASPFGSLGSFRSICRRQIDWNHWGTDCLFLSTFELFGVVAGVQ
jgi:hypothetical protein